MDISIKLEDFKLNVRAAVLIIHNNKLLAHKNLNEGFYALVGGRVKIGESSDDTVKREIKEEMGKEIKIIEYVSTIENFFHSEGTKYHEIMFVYKAEFIDEEDKKLEETIDNIEKGKDIQYEWLEIDKIDKYLLLPSVIKDVLKNNKFPVHKINNEI